MPPEANTSKDPFGQIASKLKSANNVLVTVSSSPSVDQLAACIGLTIALNKLGKHATAVFSGAIPAAIEFLEPQKTIENNTDSLRDFIIALDKSKADKLRYKVEDTVVKIFITPYMTSISEKDLEFSQGDFNVDAVLALGVHQRSDLDEAIVSHGRILHDAAILSINTSSVSDLGSVDWTDSGASSLCEMVSDIISEIGKDTFDTQIATALLTGIVAETGRFSNEKASPHTMSISGTLMAAGANAQLVASKLEDGQETPKLQENSGSPGDETSPDGTLRIEHDESETEVPPAPNLPTEPVSEPTSDLGEFLKLDSDGHAEVKDDQPAPPVNTLAAEPRFGAPLTASELPEDKQETAATDALGAPPEMPMLSRSRIGKKDASEDSSTSKVEPPDETSPPPSPPDEPSTHPSPVNDEQTLSDIEKAVGSPHHIDETQTLSDIERAVDSAHLKNQDSNVDVVRDEVKQAADMAPFVPEPIAGLNAQDVGLDLGHDMPASETDTTKPEDQGTTSLPPVSPPVDEDSLASILGQNGNNTPPPPPVPPPMMPPA